MSQRSHNNQDTIISAIITSQMAGVPCNFSFLGDFFSQFFCKINTFMLVYVTKLHNVESVLPTVKSLNFQTPENFAVIYLKLEQRD